MISYTRICLVVIALSAMILAGCSGFRASRRLDMGPFGENTAVMVNDIKQGLIIKRPILTKPYLQGETLDQFKKQRIDTGRVLGGVVLYSTQIVSISRSKLTDPEKANKLGEYIAKLASPVVQAKDPDIRISQEKLDALVKAVESQQSFLDALGAAQPLVDAVDSYINSALQIMNELATRIVEEATLRIDQHSTEVLENKRNLEALQSQTLKSFYLLSQLRAGEAGALEGLMLNDPALKKYVKGTTVSKEEADLMEKHLMNRFVNNQTMLDNLKPRIDEYHAEIRELDDLMLSFEESSRKMRISMILWARSHANLAAGIAVPPQIDVAGMLTGAASGAVNKVIP